MAGAGLAGVVANTLRKIGAVRDIRRMRGLERAFESVGGQVPLADALGIGVRLLCQKITADRPITDDELRLTAGAHSARARQADELAERLLAPIGGPA